MLSCLVGRFAIYSLCYSLPLLALFCTTNYKLSRAHHTCSAEWWSGRAGTNSATVAVRTCRSQTRPMVCHLSFAKRFVVSIKSNVRYTEVPVSKPARTMRARLTHILASMMITIEMQLYFGHPPNIHLDVRGYVGGGINRPSRTRPSRSGYLPHCHP